MITKLLRMQAQKQLTIHKTHVQAAHTFEEVEHENYSKTECVW